MDQEVLRGPEDHPLRRPGPDHLGVHTDGPGAVGRRRGRGAGSRNEQTLSDS